MQQTSAPAISVPAPVATSRLRETAIKALWLLCALVAVVAVLFILLFLVADGLPAFAEIGVIPFLTGDTWNPTFINPAYGILPLIVGTVLVTIGAMVFAVPLSIASAIYLSELAPYRVKAAIKPVIELLAGIPSVVFGFFGLLVLVEWIRVTFDGPLRRVRAGRLHPARDHVAADDHLRLGGRALGGAARVPRGLPRTRGDKVADDRACRRAGGHLGNHGRHHPGHGPRDR